jgi:hypothetical protein
VECDGFVSAARRHEWSSRGSRPPSVTSSNLAWTAIAFATALPCAARATETSAFDLSTLVPPDAQPGLMRRGYAPPGYDPRVRRQARQGPLLSFGLGGGSLYLSPEGRARIGAADVDFRVGYGFSDQFQMFMDFNADLGDTYQGKSVGSWSWTLRAQTVLVGDRAGNGLNVNFGAGFGGLTYDPEIAGRAGPTGFALAGGLSYDARLTPWFAISPEFFVTWHQVPNLPGIPDDVATMYGVRLNLLWYLR